jgi:hypothetical protein
MNVDVETMEYILKAIGMEDLGDNVDDDGFPSMSGGRR